MLALAAFARFHHLGAPALADDEYYTARSIDWLLANGVPAIPGGGYYVRGILFQYAAAGFAQLLGPDLFAYRLPSALCGLLAGGLGFLYARRHGGIALGVAVAAALLLSSWAIEFGRLVRFYTLFQVTTLLFLIALDRAYFARTGWRFTPHAVLLVSALAHELTMLLVPLLFLVLVQPDATSLRAQDRRHWLGPVLVTLLVALVVAAIIIGFDFRTHEVTDRFPEGYSVPFGGPLATPALPFFSLAPTPVLHLAVIGLLAAGLVVGFLAVRRRVSPQLEPPDLLLALALLAALFHLFAAMLLLLGVAVARYDLWRLTAQPTRRLVLLGGVLASVIGWLVLALADPVRLVNDDVVTRWAITDPSAPGAILRALWSTYFGWPDFYRPTLRPFATELPELGLAVLAALGWFVVVHRHDPWPDLLRHPAMLVLDWAVALALFTVGSSTTRYWFHLLPVLYTLLAVSLAEAVARWWQPHGGRTARGVACAAFLALFALGPDFHPRHLLGDDAADYRTGAFARFEETWYPRWDVRTAAERVARWHADAPDARIVVDTLPALSYYLDLEHAVYLDRGSQRFANVSRQRGQLDMWSGQRLLSTPEELLAYVDAAEELWLVRGTGSGKPGGIDLAALPTHRLSEIARTGLGQDDRVEIVRLRLRP